MTYGDGTLWFDPKRKRWIGRYERHTGRARRQRGQVSAKPHPAHLEKPDPTCRACQAAEAECRKKLRAALRTSADLPAYDGRMRLDGFLRHWLDEHVVSTVRARTAATYRTQVERQLIPELGGHPLSGLRSGHILAWRNSELARGRHPRSVSHDLTVLRAALQQAVRWEMIATNPAALVPGPHVPGGDQKPLTWSQAETLLRAVGEDPLRALYLLAARYGMRQGEVLGLRWRDVAEDRLVISRSLVWLYGRATLEEPKTDRSHRTVRLDSDTRAALEDRRRDQGKQMLRAGEQWSPLWRGDYDLVFTDDLGYAIERTVITRAFQRYLKAAELPKVTFHSLRATAVTHLHDSGMSMREIADVVGHSRPSETADTYTYLEESAAVKAAALFERAG